MTYLKLLSILFLSTLTVWGQYPQSDKEIVELTRLYQAREFDKTRLLAKNLVSINVSTKTKAFIYKLKGFSEYELFKDTKNTIQSRIELLNDAIESLAKSVEHDEDAEILYHLGSYRNKHAMLTKMTWRLEGLVEQWDAILSLAWSDKSNRDDILRKIDTMIRDAIEMSIIPPDSATTTSRFLSYIIRAGCNLAKEKKLLSATDSNKFMHYEKEMALADSFNVRSNEWRKKGIQQYNKLFNSIKAKASLDSVKKNYSLTREYLEKSLEDAHDVPRRIEMNRELANASTLFCSFDELSDLEKESILEYGVEHGRESYSLASIHRGVIDEKEQKLTREVYGEAVHDHAQFLYAQRNYDNAIEAGLRVFNESSQPFFKWGDYSALPMLIALSAAEVGEAKRELAIKMVKESWDSFLNETGIIDPFRPPPNLVLKTLSYAKNCEEVYRRFNHTSKDLFGKIKDELSTQTPTDR